MSTRDDGSSKLYMGGSSTSLEVECLRLFLRRESGGSEYKDDRYYGRRQTCDCSLQCYSCPPPRRIPAKPGTATYKTQHPLQIRRRDLPLRLQVHPPMGMVALTPEGFLLEQGMTVHVSSACSLPVAEIPCSRSSMPCSSSLSHPRRQTGRGTMPSLLALITDNR